MRNNLIGWALVLILVGTTPILLARQDPPREEEQPATQPGLPSSQPVLVVATDKAAVDAAMGKDVFLEGEVRSAAWSSSGKVMRVEFVGAEESKVHAVLFEKKRADFDAAFAGDFAKALAGKRIRIRSKMEDYKGRPEVKINKISDVTILDEIGR
jgi:hypothetical protein